MKLLCVLCIVCSFQAAALDREAFTFINYDLHARLEPEQQRLAVRGIITLRNDSAVPQKNVALQVSSSLTWRSIRIGQTPLEFTSQSYTSDIDHTGALSEAIVTLPDPIVPKGTIDLTIGYEGTVRLDVTRLTRIGVPENIAKRTDWDQISPAVTALRGIGYVVWYPVATEAANLSEGNSTFETVERWKNRHEDSAMNLELDSTLDRPILANGNPNLFAIVPEPGITKIGAFSFSRLGMIVPTFVQADYKKIIARELSSVHYLPESEGAAQAFAQLLTKVELPVLGRDDGSLQVVQLPNPDAAPFVSGSLMLTPLDSPITSDTELNAVYALAEQVHNSRRTWIHDGLSHYAQLWHIQKEGGRQAVLGYLNTRLPLLTQGQKPRNTTQENSRTTNEASSSLINAGEDPSNQVKAMWVWWMLRDMLGETAMSGAIMSDQASEDKDASHFQRLVEKQSKKDLEWFFDDWVYRDKGLPDFRVVSVYPRRNLKEGYLTTVTVENLGSAAAEVPVMIHDAGGDFTERLLVKGKSHSSIRFSTHGIPDGVTVNDGSVPESDMSNNTFKIERISGYFSLRDGSKSLAPITVVVFPSIVMSVLWLVLAAIVFARRSPHAFQTINFAYGFLLWVVVPAVALWAGTLPLSKAEN